MWRALPALILTDLRLALRMRTVVFFNYLFPLMFFFAFAEFLDAHGEACAQVAGMVLVIGILGNGLWGAGMRLVQEREANILRRFCWPPWSPAGCCTCRRWRCSARWRTGFTGCRCPPAGSPCWC
jgi:hypothetical protein